MTNKTKTLSELARLNNMNDAELVAYCKEKFGWSAERTTLMLDIERGVVDSDIIEVESEADSNA